MEAAAEGEPEPDAVVSVDDVELRSLLAFSVRPSAFPGDRERLLDAARDEDAPQRVVDWLESLPAERVFPTLQAVWDELGGGHESRDVGPDSVPVPQRTAAQVSLQPATECQTDRPDDRSPQPERNKDDQPQRDESVLGRVAQVALTGAIVVVGLAVGTARAVLRRRWP
jgi:hypothetical protein